ELREGLPEMPWARLARFEEAYALQRVHAEPLTATRALADYYEAVVGAGAPPRDAATWVMGEVLAAVNADACAIDDFRVGPAALAELLRIVDDGTISRTIAQQV